MYVYVIIENQTNELEVFDTLCEALEVIEGLLSLDDGATYSVVVR